MKCNGLGSIYETLTQSDNLSQCDKLSKCATLSQCATRPGERKHRCKERSKDVSSDQPWKGDPREVRIVGIPATKTIGT